MHNETIYKLETMIKLRADNVYDLYVNGEHIASRGSHTAILEELKLVFEKKLLEM